MESAHLRRRRIEEGGGRSPQLRDALTRGLVIGELEIGYWGVIPALAGRAHARIGEVIRKLD